MLRTIPHDPGKSGRPIEKHPSTTPRVRLALFALALVGLVSALRPTPTRAQIPLTFAHPGALHSANDLATSFTLASQGREPWASGLAKIVEQVEGPNSIRGHFIEAPHTLSYTSDIVDSLIRDGDVAYTCALYWYAYKAFPAKGALTSACRSKANEILAAWVGVVPVDSLQFIFRIPSLLLAADVLGGSAQIPGFDNWLRTIVLPQAQETHSGNLMSAAFAPRGQAQGSWALYAVLLTAHLLHDDVVLRDYAGQFVKFATEQVDTGDTNEFVAGVSANDASLGNERLRWAQQPDPDGNALAGIRYTFVSLTALTSSMRTLRNITGIDLFNTAPSSLDASGKIGRNIGRAIQTAFYYLRHKWVWPYNHDGQTQQDWEHAGHFFDAMSAIYQSPEYASFALPQRPYTYSFDVDRNIYRHGDAHASYLLSGAAQSIDMSAPGTQTFEQNAGPFSVRNGSWNTVMESGSPSGNKVYHQSQYTSAATATLGTPAWLDYGIQARIKVLSFESSASAVGLFARYNDSDNYYSFMWNASDRKLRIEKRFNGVHSVLASVPYSFATGKWYTFKVVVNGPTLVFVVEDETGTPASVPFVDESQTAKRHAFMGGKPGLQAHRASAQFDNVCVAINGSSCYDADRFLPPSLIMSIL